MSSCDYVFGFQEVDLSQLKSILNRLMNDSNPENRFKKSLEKKENVDKIKEKLMDKKYLNEEKYIIDYEKIKTDYIEKNSNKEFNFKDFLKYISINNFKPCNLEDIKNEFFYDEDISTKAFRFEYDGSVYEDCDIAVVIHGKIFSTNFTIMPNSIEVSSSNSDITLDEDKNIDYFNVYNSLTPSWEKYEIIKIKFSLPLSNPKNYVLYLNCLKSDTLKTVWNIHSNVQIYIDEKKWSKEVYGQLFHIFRLNNNEKISHDNFMYVMESSYQNIIKNHVKNNEQNVHRFKIINKDISMYLGYCSGEFAIDYTIKDKEKLIKNINLNQTLELSNSYKVTLFEEGKEVPPQYTEIIDAPKVQE